MKLHNYNRRILAKPLMTNELYRHDVEQSLVQLGIDVVLNLSLGEDLSLSWIPVKTHVVHAACALCSLCHSVAGHRGDQDSRVKVPTLLTLAWPSPPLLESLLVLALIAQ